MQQLLSGELVSKSCWAESLNHRQQYELSVTQLNRSSVFICPFPSSPAWCRTPSTRQDCWDVPGSELCACGGSLILMKKWVDKEELEFNWVDKEKLYLMSSVRVFLPMFWWNWGSAFCCWLAFMTQSCCHSVSTTEHRDVLLLPLERNCGDLGDGRDLLRVSYFCFSRQNAPGSEAKSSLAANMLWFACRAYSKHLGSH